MDLSAVEETLPRIAFLKVPADMLLVTLSIGSPARSCLGWDREPAARHHDARPGPAPLRMDRGTMPLGGHLDPDPGPAPLRPCIDGSRILRAVRNAIMVPVAESRAHPPQPPRRRHPRRRNRARHAHPSGRRARAWAADDPRPGDVSVGRRRGRGAAGASTPPGVGGPFRGSARRPARPHAAHEAISAALGISGRRRVRRVARNSECPLPHTFACTDAPCPSRAEVVPNFNH